MIYKTLETCPYKVVMKMVNDPVENLHLLTDDEEPDFEKLATIWIGIYEELMQLDPNNENDKILKLEREISSLKRRHDFIQLAIVSLEFDFEEFLFDKLIEFGYKLSKENYYPDLDKIRRESKGILLKVSQFEKQLPISEVGETDFKKVNIDEILAFYSSILGIDFDYNTVSFTKVLALQNQVSEKIKAIEKQNTVKK